MKAKQIINHINNNGGFDNWQHWTREQIAEWIMASFDCGRKTANAVSWKI